MNKLPYLDFAKGVCMILIIFGHIFPYESHPAVVYAYSFHVPAFFIISGILLEHTKEYERPILTLAKNNILRLIVPYISFETVYNVIYCIYNGFGNFGWLTWQTFTLYGTGLATWFLPVLFAAKVYLLLVKKIVKNQIIVGVACIVPFCFAMFIGLNDSNVHWLFFIVLRSCNAIGLLWVGTLLHRYLDSITKSSSTLMLCIVVSLGAGLSNGRISTCWMDYRNPILYILAAISGTIMLICIGSRLKSYGPISFFSKNSVIVLGIHEQIQLLLIRYLRETTVDEHWFAFMILIILLQYPIAYFINRFAPFMVGKWYSS